MTPKPEEIEAVRRSIENLDRELVRLLAKRLEAARAIGSLKALSGRSGIRDPERERVLLETWCDEAEAAGLPRWLAGRILTEILEHSRRAQEDVFLGKAQDGEPILRLKVGYQGVPASYSDLCIDKLFAAREGLVLEKQGFETFSHVARALERQDIDCALLPVENSTCGGIGEVGEILVKGAFSVLAEEILPVEHVLAALPGTRRRDVKAVRSHRAALEQCRSLLERMEAARVEVWHDTADAARSIADEKAVGVAAICSMEAAQRHGLEVLARDVADNPENYTRFLLLAREPGESDPRLPSKTSLVLALRDEKGALAQCLEVFARHEINLTRIESRPKPQAPWEYIFLIDFEGHRDDASVRDALADLPTYTSQLRVLGSYPMRRPSDDHLQSLPVPRVNLDDEGIPKVARPLIEDVPLTALRPDGKKSGVRVGDVLIGGGGFTLIAGPCAVESREQVFEAAAMVRERGARILRGGAFKPRTSPYSFQGLGYQGVDFLVEAGRAHGMPVVTEVLSPEDVTRVAKKADMLQVGARNMQNFELLKELGRVGRPVLLKRGMSATLDELLHAAEYIMAGGNHQVVLCERGIRTFEPATRATLDVSAIPVLKERTHLPVVVDPSHAAGRRSLVIPLALAAVAAGADGLIVECHPHPDAALCDKDQALSPDDLERLVGRIQAMIPQRQAGVVGR